MVRSGSIRPGKRAGGSGWLWAAVLGAVILAGALLARQGGAAGASALAASPEGLLAARTYLERRGSRVSLADAPLETFASGDALVVAFPAARFPAREEIEGARRGLAAGGTLVFAYSGSARSVFEDEFANGLGLSVTPSRGSPPLGPFRWWARAKTEWRLRPEPALGPAAQKIVVRAPDRIPKAADDAAVLYRGGGAGEEKTPAVFSIVRGRGRIVVLPSDALSNGRLAEGGNADLLESLRAAIPGRITFAEYRHGLVSSRARAGDSSGIASSLDLLLAELVLLYLLAAFALGRRFGPSWEEPPEISGSASAFLLGLGALHRRLRHFQAASSRLVETAGRLDPRARTDVFLSLQAAAERGGETEFLELAKAVARAQRRWRSR